MRYNETNGEERNNKIIFYNINDSDPVFEVSSLVCSDIVGNILRANYDLYVIGDITVDTITVMGNFYCTGKCQINDMNVQGNCFISDGLELKKGLVGEILQTTELIFDSLEVHGDILCQSINFDDSLICDGKTIIADGIMGGGQIYCDSVVCGEYSFVENDSNIVIASEVEKGSASDIKVSITNEEFLRNEKELGWYEYSHYLEKLVLDYPKYESILNKYLELLRYTNLSKLKDLRQYTHLAYLIYLSGAVIGESDLATTLKKQLIFKADAHLDDLAFPSVSQDEFAVLMYEIKQLKPYITLNTEHFLREQLFGKIGLKYNTVCAMLGEE